MLVTLLALFIPVINVKNYVSPLTQVRLVLVRLKICLVQKQVIYLSEPRKKCMRVEKLGLSKKEKSPQRIPVLYFLTIFPRQTLIYPPTPPLIPPVK